MSDTSHGQGYEADQDEAAFLRLEQGLAALRRDTSRLRQPQAGTPGPAFDPRELDASLAEVNRRIDALASRSGAPADTGPILAALTAVEAKISSLTVRLDRFAEQSALTEAIAASNAKIEALAARLDARLNQLQDKQVELNARLDNPAVPQTVVSSTVSPAVAAPVTPALTASTATVRPAQPVVASVKSSAPTPAPMVPPPPRPAPTQPAPQSAFAALSKSEPEPRRSHIPALLALVVMVLAAAAALAWMRPDLVKSEWIHKEMLDPAREKATRWLHLSQQNSPSAPAVLA